MTLCGHGKQGFTRARKEKAQEARTEAGPDAARRRSDCDQDQLDADLSAEDSHPDTLTANHLISELKL
jgi:hypothetical protein